MAHIAKYKATSVGLNSMKSLLDAMDSADESVSSWKRSEKRLDGLGWQLRTSPEGSGREVCG